MAKVNRHQSTLKFDKAAAEDQLRDLQKDLRFTVHEFTVETCVEKLRSKTEEFRIPDYQREMVWSDDQKSKFIESVLLGLPIPFIFGVAEEEYEDRVAIVDGRQRLGTLDLFLDGRFFLSDLEKLDRLEGYYYDDLSETQQRRFKRRNIRVVILDGADTSTQFDMFERLNTTGKHPERAEIRRGAYPGKFMDLVKRLAKDPVFESLTPMNDKLVSQREREELVLRLLALSNRFLDFKHSVKGFMDAFVREQNELSARQPEILNMHEQEFRRVCNFAHENLPGGNFARGDRNQTARVRFEALAVGIALALRRRSDLKKADMSWADGPEFEALTRTDASNSRPKLAARIQFARDHVLPNAI